MTCQNKIRKRNLPSALNFKDMTLFVFFEAGSGMARGGGEMGHISKTCGAMQILPIFLFLACQDTPLTRFLGNLKKKRISGLKNGKVQGFFAILTKNFAKKS